MDFETVETVTLKLHRDLGDSARRATKFDYGIHEGGESALRVRRALKGGYLLIS